MKFEIRSSKAKSKFEFYSEVDFHAVAKKLRNEESDASSDASDVESEEETATVLSLPAIRGSQSSRSTLEATPATPNSSGDRASPLFSFPCGSPTTVRPPACVGIKKFQSLGLFPAPASTTTVVVSELPASPGLALQ